MTFFVVTAAIMAVSILLIYKLCRFFGLELKWISLVLCAVFAFGVNGATILLSPFLTPEHYVKLTVLVLVAAALVTLINEYLLKRDKRQQLATAEGAVMAMEELAEEAEEPAPAAQPALDEAPPAEAQPKKEDPPQAVPEARKTPIEPPARPQAAEAEPGGALSQRLLEALKANEQPRTETAPQAEKAAEAAATETSAKEKPAEALAAEKKPAGGMTAETAPAKEEVKQEAAPTSEPTYCIVLASQVKLSNAESYVEQLKKRGIKDAEVYIHRNTVRVVCGSYKTESEAYRHLNKMNNDEEFAEAWVYKKVSA